MDSELATAAIIAGYWQATAVIIGVVVLATGAFSLVSLWAGRHIDAKFDKHAGATDAKFDTMDAKLDNHAAATDAKLDKHAAATDAKLDKHAAAMDAKLDNHAAATDAKLDKFAAVLEAFRKEVADALDKQAGAVAAVMEEHRRELEEHRKETKAHSQEVEAAIARGTKEHEDWRVEMKAINEKVTDLYIEREVERRMQASHGGAAGSD